MDAYDRCTNLSKKRSCQLCCHLWSRQPWRWSTWRTSKKCNDTRNHWTSARYDIRWLADESAWIETIGISKERVGYIFHEGLDMKKLCARLVPRLLTADPKRTQMKISEQCLECFNKNKTDFVRW